MRRAVGLGDLRKGIKKTFTFYLCHITSDESLPSLDCSALSEGELSELLCTLLGTEAVAAPALSTAKTRSWPRLGPFQAQVIIRRHLLFCRQADTQITLQT